MTLFAACLGPSKLEHYHFCVKSPVSKFTPGLKIMKYAQRTTRMYLNFGGAPFQNYCNLASYFVLGFLYTRGGTTKHEMRGGRWRNYLQLGKSKLLIIFLLVIILVVVSISKCCNLISDDTKVIGYHNSLWCSGCYFFTPLFFA